MFGIAVAALSSLNDEEKELYQRDYCGLCHALKQDFGVVGRMTLSYDLTFLEILYNSLFEPEETIGEMRCPTHPLKKVKYISTPFSVYCAELSIAFAYHKCLDDISDDSSLTARAMSVPLEKSYSKVRLRIPGQCLIIEDGMAAIHEIESDSFSSPDAASIVFGEILSFCFECVPDHFPCLWSQDLKDLGFWLGRFIYLMDAAVDLSEDAKKRSYNPFLKMGLPRKDSAFMRDVLSVLAGRASFSFEKLPIVENAHLLRGILYQGLWQKFNKEYEKR